jgi:serine/threonine-protein kinase RsbT
VAQIVTASEVDLVVVGTVDVERARRETRDVASGLGFDAADSEMVVLAVSELATNITRYTGGGRIRVRPLVASDAVGIEVESRDDGPGIGGASNSSGLGLGLAGVRRLMDEFELSSAPSGTTVVCRKWRKTR